MIIDVEFDSSTKGAPAGFFTAVNAAVEFWERELTNPVTVTIDFGYNSVDGQTIGSAALAESETDGINATYAQVKAGLTAAATSANDMISVAHLPSSDPTSGAGFFVAAAEAEVLGLTPTANALVGYAGLSSAFPFTFNPNDRAVSGDYDAVGAMEHEISEVLGRIAGSGTIENGVADFSPLDLFRYVSAGHLAVTPEAAYFSIDGTHLLLPFNDPTTGNDAGDWGPGVNGDSFGFGEQGVAGLVSPTDLELMDVLGYKLAPDPTAKDDFNADGQSDFLIQSTAGRIDVGEVVGGKASFTSLAGIASTWAFEEDGDFLGAGSDQYLIENTVGTLDVGAVTDGKASYAKIGAIASNWKFVGVGDFLGLADGDQFLVQNAAGTLDVGNAESGKAVYTTVGRIASAWTFEGSGDFKGDGKSDFLIEGTSGAIDVGEVENGKAAFTRIGAISPAWKFVGTGDFLGDGHDQFLIEDAGEVYMGQVESGRAVLTHIANLASTWKFVGSGDYLAEGHDQFLIENTAGGVDVGDWTNNQIRFTPITRLGSQWTFRDDSSGRGGAGGADSPAIHPAATRPSAAGFAQAIGGFAAEPFAVVGAHSGSSALVVSAAALVTVATSRA